MKNTYFYRGKLCTLETECSAILRVRVAIFGRSKPGHFYFVNRVGDPGDQICGKPTPLTAACRSRQGNTGWIPLKPWNDCCAVRTSASRKQLEGFFRHKRSQELQFQITLQKPTSLNSSEIHPKFIPFRLSKSFQAVHCCPASFSCLCS